MLLAPLTAALVAGSALALQDGDDLKQDIERLSPATAGVDRITPRSPDGWKLLDGVILTVDELYATYGELREREDFVASLNTITTEEQWLVLRRDVLQAMGRELLSRSGGQSLEIPAEQLEASLRFQERDNRDLDGAVNYGERIRERGRDPLTEVRSRRDEILGAMWERRQIGSERFDRVLYDTYVRPGRLRAEYPRYAESTGAADFTLRQLTVLGSQVGGVDTAREVLGDLRQQILDGREDMAELAESTNLDEQLAARRGLLPTQRMSTAGDSAFHRWLTEAEEGDISPPLGVGPRGLLAGGGVEPIGWTILRVEGLDPGPPPAAFETLEAQAAIRSARATALEDLRRQWAYDRQGQRATIWVDSAVAPFWSGPGADPR